MRQSIGRFLPGAPLCETLESRVHLAAGDYVLPAGTPPLVRLAYLIPSNRSPQSDAVANLQAALPVMQQWCREALSRSGLEEKTFKVETLTDGTTPKVHVVNIPQTDTQLRDTDTLVQWGNVNSAASADGIPLFASGQVWLLIAEIHAQVSDGSVSGNIALGASNGSGADGGVAQIGSQALPFLNPAMLTDNRAYAGMSFPGLGPYPLVQNVTFPSFEGTTLSSVSSTKFGAMLHELSHGFGLPHDFRNDRNFDGNLMGNGFRGFRGLIHPEQYPADYAYLQHGQALVINNSRYFNPAASVPDAIKPTLSISDGGLVNGQQRINFTASDPSGLTVAVLQYAGDQVAELPLSGTSVSTSIATPYFTAAQSGQFAVMVYDIYGNRQRQTLSLTPTGGNPAAKPSVNTNLHTVSGGQTLTLDVNSSSDPDGTLSQLSVEWDLDGNGTFDTSPSSNRTLTTSFSQIGPRMVRARLTDAGGAQSISAPMPIRVVPIFRGGNEANEYYVRRSPADAGKYEVFPGSAPTGTPIVGSMADASPLVVNSGGGDDHLTIDLTNGKPFPTGGLSFDGGAGTNDRVRIVGSGGDDTLSITPTSLTIVGIGSVPIAGVENAQFDLGAGNDRLTIDQPLAYSPVFNGGTGDDVLFVAAGTYAMTADGRDGNERLFLGVGSGARVTIGAPQHLASLVLHPGAEVRAVAGAGPIVTGALGIDPAARLDIGDNPLIYDYTPDDSLALSMVRASIISAYQPGGGPHWGGNGLTSSLLLGGPGYGLGYAEASDVLKLSPGQTGMFMSEPVDSTAVLVRLTRAGDADLDGQVTFRDFQRLELGFGRPGVLWSDGDFDYDGQTGAGDFGAMYANIAAAPVASNAESAPVRKAARPPPLARRPQQPPARASRS